MNRRALALAVAAVLAGAVPTLAIAGYPDEVPAATLIVPFFETGINSTTYPHDTLMVVQNILVSPYMIHWHFWDIDGNATALYGNTTLSSTGTWSAACRDLLNAGPASARTALTQGNFYQGFVTIDLVSASTSLNPKQAGFPFSDFNALEGSIYYTRLSQGSANGLSMLPLEYVGSAVNNLLRDFYNNSDGREEIDVDARACAAQLARGAACTGDDNELVHRTHLRVFGSTALSGTSRHIIFTWSQLSTGGPSVICPSAPSHCATTYDVRRYNESGTVVYSGTQRLDHVVNAFAAFSPTESGYSSWWSVPSIATQYYAFAINSAAPSGNPNLTWDAIFPAYINP